MRLGSFRYTWPQMLDRSKTVTRRLAWCWAHAGVLVLPVYQAMGRKAGEPLVHLDWPIEVIHERWEPLDQIDHDDCAAEGFPELDPAGFVAMFCDHMRCAPDVLVHRIAFRHVTDYTGPLRPEKRTTP